MRSMASILTSIALAFVCSLYAPSARAQLRVFVGAQGSDSNPCTFAQPCRTFNRAASVVAAGGEIDVLDPAGYGSLSITKSLSVQGHGFAGISPAAAASAGVFVAAGQNDKVYLNGLIIEGQNFGALGIGASSVGHLIIENCVVRNWRGSGIGLTPAAVDALVFITVANTVVAHNGDHGIYVQPPSTNNQAVYVNFNRVESYNNAGSGIGVYGNYLSNFGSNARLFATIIDSVATQNGPYEFFAIGYATGGFFPTTYLRVFRSTAWSLTGLSIAAQDNAYITLFDSFAPNLSWQGLGACIETSGNNSGVVSMTQNPTCPVHPLQ